MRKTVIRKGVVIETHEGKGEIRKQEYAVKIWQGESYEWEYLPVFSAWPASGPHYRTEFLIDARRYLGVDVHPAPKERKGWNNVVRINVDG